MSEMHLKQSGITSSACGSFNKNKKEYKNLRKQQIQDILHKKINRCLTNIFKT